jgi:hypothetical protein
MTQNQPPNLNAVFVSRAADVLADTERGMTGGEIARAFRAYATDADVELPHPNYPWEAPNKRTAFAENLLAFDEADRYRIISELADHPTVQLRNSEGASKLKLQMMSRFGHLAAQSLGAEVNQALISQTQHWLGAFADVLELYNQALEKYQGRVFVRNLLDDLRLALEKLLRHLLGNSKSLENQLAELGKFVKDRGGSPELSNMFVKLVDYYSKYQNTYVKHDASVIEDEIEFIIEITSAFMKHLVRIAGRAV